MKRITTFLLATITGFAFAQDGAPASPYYNGFNFNQTGTALKNALATKITNTHVDQLTYSQLWDALKIVDRDPDAPSTNVLLVYGFSSGLCPAASSSDNDHRRRNKESNGGATSCEWNREHVYPQSLGNPDLGQDGPGADAHHLRACDVDRNGQRGNKLYVDGSGNSGSVGSGWYPGDEWKGDVARILMYMYLRYGNQCIPKVVVNGATVSTDNNMPLLLLEWNAEDPVTPFEDYRNTYLGNANNAYGQGNRNPFIDNPYLATVIWGGPVAQDRWGIAGVEDLLATSLAVYPNPAVNNEVNIYSEAELDEIQLINLNGQLIQYIKKPKGESNTYRIEDLPQGFYLLRVTADEKTATKKIVVN
ncbi:endonuclease [Flavobacterium sp. MFBS3-15]|uniref:endonuclease n=1 Tax=Flavobacterium sp. MFBS3-15 TaxID=2989816 RepID=UPI0022363B8E|nr:endonuclease [Flavobacterium sp. MFBS3-15]MCW4469874.1 endonuclease [Flavobacterium sp. MFBS3-15]